MTIIRNMCNRFGSLNSVQFGKFYPRIGLPIREQACEHPFALSLWQQWMREVIDTTRQLIVFSQWEESD